MFSVCLLCLAGTSTYASTTGTTYTWALLPYLTAQESWVSQLFDTTYDSIYAFFAKSWLNIIKSMEYQSLVCLWALSDSSVLSQMQKDKLTIKTSFSKDFLDIKNHITDLEEKNTLQTTNNLSLFESWTSYEIEKAKLKQEIDTKVAVHSAIISWFSLTYTTKITDLIKTFQQYLSGNAAFLQGVSTKMTKIQSVLDAFAAVEATITKINTKITGFENISQNIEAAKKNGVAALDSNIQLSIATLLKRYKNFQIANDVLTGQKSYIMGQFQLDLDEYVANNLKSRYDRSQYLSLQDPIKVFSSKFYTQTNQLNCSSITNTTDETTYLLTKIAAMASQVNSWWAKIDKEWVSTTFKNQLLSWFQTTYLQKYKQRYAEYQTYLTNYIKTAIQKVAQSVLPTPPTITSPVVATGSEIKVSGVSFTKPFNSGEYNIKIKSLQQLMTNLQLYSWAIDGIYNKATKNAVYQFQLSKWLLKGYEKKPATRGRMGPATRAAINNLTK